MMKLEYFGTLVTERKPSGRLRHFSQHEIPVQQEDAGQSWIAEFGGSDEAGMFVRVQSWDPDGSHDLMKALVNKRVRVTVEVLD